MLGMHVQIKLLLQAKLASVASNLGFAGLDVGSIKHVPSTTDLINQLQEAGLPVPSRESLRRRTSSFLGSLENLHALGQEAAASDTPRSQDDASAFALFLSEE